MAPAFVLIGSVTGFMTGLMAWLAFETSLLAAVAIWIISGPLSAMIAVAADRVRPQGAPARVPSNLVETA
jgi:hypothetical protein